MCNSIVSPVCSVLCKALSTINCLFCTLHFPVELESVLQIAVSPQNGSCHRRVQLNHHWADMVPGQEAHRAKPRVHGAVWLCLKATGRTRLPLWCLALRLSQLCAHQLCHQEGTLWSVLQLTECSQGSSLLGTKAETSLPYSRGCCRGIIIHIRDKMDPKPNLKWKQMQFQLT